MAEDEMVGWHHRLDYHEVWTPTQSIPISSLRATMNKIDRNSFPNRTYRHVLRVTVIQMFVWWESKCAEK